MKKNIFILSILSFTLIFTQCKDKIQKDYDNASASASFKYYTSTDTTIIDPNTIKVNESVIFESLENDKGGNTFCVYTGTKGNEYQPYYNMKDSVQSNKGKGSLLNNKNGIYKSDPIPFTKPGIYKIYMIASVINPLNGDVKRDIDSSKTITVIDPNASIAKILSVQMTLPKAITALIDEDNHKIIFSNIDKAKDSTKFLACFITVSATSNNIKLNGKLITSSTKVSLKNGDKISVESNEGGNISEYTIEIKYKILTDPAIREATVSNKTGEFTFSIPSLKPVGNTLTIPSLPKGTDYISLKYTLAHTSITSIIEAKNTTITTKAQDGVTTATYSIVFSATQANASATLNGVVGGSSFIKKVGDNYELILPNGTSLSSVKLDITLGSFTKIEYSSASDYSNLTAYSSSKEIDFSSKDTYYFRATCGTDVKEFTVKVSAF